MNGDLCFIEQTLFMIFLWIGIWGLVDVILDHQNQTYESRIKIYIFFIFISFFFLYLRGHTSRLASF
jgi:hypothetical protein